jgi:hypothetical protein
MQCVRAVLLSLLRVTLAAAQNQFVYTNNQSSPNTVTGFLVNSDGSLTALGGGTPLMTGGKYLRCRQICVGESLRLQQIATAFNERLCNRFNINQLRQQNSTAFNRGQNLVRDQGVGGSNPLSPANLFNHLQPISGLPPSAVWATLRL